jgi:hypothetical protein
MECNHWFSLMFIFFIEIDNTHGKYSVTYIAMVKYVIFQAFCTTLHDVLRLPPIQIKQIRKQDLTDFPD